MLRESIYCHHFLSLNLARCVLIPFSHFPVVPYLLFSAPAAPPPSHAHHESAVRYQIVLCISRVFLDHFAGASCWLRGDVTGSSSQSSAGCFNLIFSSMPRSTPVYVIIYPCHFGGDIHRRIASRNFPTSVSKDGCFFIIIHNESVQVEN